MLFMWFSVTGKCSVNASTLLIRGGYCILVATGLLLMGTGLLLQYMNRRKRLAIDVLEQNLQLRD